MKRFLSTLLYSLFILFFVNISAFCADNVSSISNQLSFNNKIFTLKFSSKIVSGGYMNEYYKTKEKGHGWTELITVMSHPNSKYTPSDFVKGMMSAQPKVNGFDNIVVIDKKTNEVTAAFFLVGKENNYDYFEFNVLKVAYKDGNKKGLKTVQYAKKYKFTDAETCVQQLNKMNKTKMKYFNLVYDMQIPKIINKELKAWKE